MKLSTFRAAVPYVRETAVAAGSLVLAGAAFASGSDPFTDAMADATTAVGTYAAALVGLSAVAVVFMIAMKYVKRIPRAS